MPDYKEILVKHDLMAKRPQKVSLLIAQFTTSHEDWEKKDGLYFQKDPDSVWSNIEKLLIMARQCKVNMVIFPELSVPSQFIFKIQSWSNETGITVIAGSHYHKTNNKYISRCPIIVSGKVFFTEKITPAPSEKSSFEGEGIISGNNIALITNSPVGNFGVLICSDYLDQDVRKILIQNNIDILCVPAFQKKSELYYSRMNIDCEESENGIYIVYSNMQNEMFGDGHSALFGKMDNLWFERIIEKGLTDANPPHKIFEMKSNQEYIVVQIDIDHKRPYINRNVKAEPNVFFYNTEIATADLTTTEFLNCRDYADEIYEKNADVSNTVQTNLSITNLIIQDNTHILLPYESPFYPYGIVPLNNQSYVRRDSDKQLESLLNSEPFICLHGAFRLGKSSLLIRVPQMFAKDWIVFRPDFEFYQRSFEEELFDDLQDLNIGICNCKSLDKILKQTKMVFLIDEIGKCSDKDASMLIEKIYALFEHAPQDHIRVVLTIPIPLNIYIQNIGLKNPKYYDCWKSVKLKELNEIELQELLAKFPQQITLSLKKNLSKIQQCTSMKPNKVQEFCDGLWKYLRNEEISISDIDQKLESYIYI